MEIRAALAGNPNCGKTTMINALTGANQYVGNWPGVTVEKKENAYGIIGQVGGRLWIEEKMIEDIEAGRKCCVTEDEEESGHA